MRGARTLRHLTRGKEVHRLVAKHRHLNVEHADVDEVALSGSLASGQSGKYGNGRVSPSNGRFQVHFTKMPAYFA